MKEWEEWLQHRVSQLGSANVAEELGLVAIGHGKELELVGLEESVWRRIGGLTPLRKVMASRHGIWLAHGCAGTVDNLEVVVGEGLGPVEDGGHLLGVHLDT